MAAPYDSSGRQMANALPKTQGVREFEEAGENAANQGLSPRQQRLNQLYSYYRCAQYEARKVDWDGTERLDPIQHEVVSQSGVVPAGFTDPGGQTLPLKFRRPSTPYSSVKVVVDRFTSLLFGSRRHPAIEVPDDSKTEDWLNAWAEAVRLWPKMMQARTMGGAMGAVAIGFKFVRGSPRFEVHDPRWCWIEWEDQEEGTVQQLIKRYMYPREMRDEEGHWQEVWFWYRRLIDDQKDVVWQDVPVEDGREPNWAALEHTQFEHGFGFTPIVWVQNKPVQDELDGDPDAQGVFDLAERIDAHLSQADRSIIANCDPTLNINTDAELREVQTGSDNALKLPAGSNAQFLEISGSGPQAAREYAKELRGYMMEVARVVPEDTDNGNRDGSNYTPKTATEVRRRYSAMIEEADIRREQYGEQGVKPLLKMVLRAVRGMQRPVIRQSGAPPEVVQRVVDLPPLVNDDGTTEQRNIGKGEQVHLRWPNYFESSLEDINKATQAAALAYKSRLIDQERAVQFVAQYYDVEDVNELLERLEEQEPDPAMLAAERTGRPPPGQEQEPPQPPKRGRARGGR